MPIPASGRPAVALAMKVVRASSAARGVVVGQRPSASARPRASTIRARILVPPVSTPANTRSFIPASDRRADDLHVKGVPLHHRHLALTISPTETVTALASLLLPEECGVHLRDT